MPGRVRVDHTGQRIGPFIVTEPSQRKRHWFMRCAQGHVSERRIDQMLRVKPETLRCLECRRRPAIDLEAQANAFRAFLASLSPASKAALRLLLATQQ